MKKRNSVILAIGAMVIAFGFVFLNHDSNPDMGFDKPEGYYDYFREITVPFGAEISGYMPNYALFEYNKALQSKSNFKSASEYNWVQRGPANVGGRTRTVLIDPDDATGKTWFAGSVSGGVWKTPDAGNSWLNLTPGLPNLSTATLAMSKANTQVIYAGTGEGYGGEGMVSGNGIYKSSDKGSSWLPVQSTQDDKHFRYVNKIWASPSNENILLVATNTGIYKSENGGESWDSVYTAGYAVQDLAQNPSNENVIYAGVNSLGVIKSFDQGNSWQVKNSGMAELKRVSVSVSAVDTSYVFAGVEAPGNNTHVYHSRDAGENWQINYNTDGLFIDFHQAQGWFNNVVAAHPFDKEKVYIGGVYFGMLEFGSATYTSGRDVVRVDTTGISNFISFVNFGGSSFNGALATGVDEEIYDRDKAQEMEDFVSIELRFDTNLSQKAHRFTVPEGEGGGVPPELYSYNDYVDVPFQVWDVENNRQLMVSFRDQDRNGKFNLVEREYDDIINGREYIFIHAYNYDATSPNVDIAQDGGYQEKQLYFLWPTLPEDKDWNEDSLTKGTLSVKWGSVQFRDAYTTILADDNLNEELHVDHHDIQFFIPEGSADSFVIVEANDGGLGLSYDEGSTWEQINKNYLTTQFYGVAKRPGRQEYIGGLQDNGTWQSPLNSEATETSEYEFRIEGDGFEALWHPWYPQRILASSYNNLIKISNDFGETWKWIDNAILGDGPFITKLSHSRENPDLVFAVGSKGVYRHTNFGFGTAPWQLIDLGESWAVNNVVLSSHNVKVSKAKPSVIWAGGGMYRSPDLNLFVSKDYGLTFDSVSIFQDEELGYISGIATHPTNPGGAFALFSYQGKAKVLRTDNYGKTWIDISGFSGHDGDSSINGFPDVVVNDLLVMPNDTNNIWVATEIGLFESIDNGKNWQYSNAGLPAVSIWQLEIIDGTIVVATHGRGIWTAELGYSKIADRRISTNTFKLYPNPANDFVSIETSGNDVSKRGTISIIDLSGKTWLEKQLSASGKEDLDISSLSPGNYIVLYEIEGLLNTQKLIVK